MINTFIINFIHIINITNYLFNMRYVITKDQFHKIVYNILDEMLDDGEVEKRINPYAESGKTYRLDMYDKDGKEFMNYFYFEPGEDDDGNQHDGHGSVHVNWELNDKIRKLLSLRQTKVLDVIADWVTDKFDVDVDEVSIYPTKPSNY
jgi:hypothetical protein